MHAQRLADAKRFPARASGSFVEPEYTQSNQPGHHGGSHRHQGVFLNKRRKSTTEVINKPFFQVIWYLLSSDNEIVEYGAF
jgi:hypothetical protein